MREITIKKEKPEEKRMKELEQEITDLQLAMAEFYEADAANTGGTK